MTFAPLRSGQGARVCWRGRELVNFASEDYLHLAGDRRLARAARGAADRYGCGAGAPPAVAGPLPPQRALERDLARFAGTDDALVASSAFTAAAALLTALAGPGDALFLDPHDHPALAAAAALTGAGVHRFDHGRSADLEAQLIRHGFGARRRVIAVDTVFGLDGDLAPLAEIARLAEGHDATLVAHEAEAFGIFGPNGRGLAEWLPAGARAARVVVLGSLGTALGAQGGFAAGGRAAIGAARGAGLYQRETPPAPPVCAAARAALRVVAAEPERRLELLRLAAQLREGLQTHHVDVSTSQSQIVSLRLGDAAAVRRLAERLRARGFLTTPLVPPAVPEGAARLRLAVTAGHHAEEVARFIPALLACTGGARDRAAG